MIVSAIQRYPVLSFYALSYCLAWSVFGCFTVLSNVLGFTSGAEALHAAEIGQAVVEQPVLNGILYLFSRLADFSFTIAGLALITLTQGRKGWHRIIDAFRFRAHIWLWVVAALPLFTYGVAAIISGATLYEPQVSWSALLFSLETGLIVSLLLRGAMGEEIGLRLFALEALLKRQGLIKASILMGALWFGWHIPVLIGRDIVSIIAFAVLSFNLTALLNALYLQGFRSLWFPLLFHALMNWEEGFEVLWPSLQLQNWETLSSLLLLVISTAAWFWLWKLSKPLALDTQSIKNAA